MKILVADDDPVTRSTVAACLAGEGFEVVSAADGKEALALWKAATPDLVCLDIMMPGADGFEVCRRIRQRDGKTPILFLSAKNEEVDVVVGLELGADDFVRKPFGKRELMARVRVALRRAMPVSGVPQVFDFGSWTVYPTQLRAEGNGLEIDLSPREVSMLMIMRERRGEVVTRDAMLDRCWGVEYYPESRTLDQHIAKLRKKIEADPSHPVWIETVRGLGYRMRRE